jgi:hypothetical protein
MGPAKSHPPSIGAAWFAALWAALSQPAEYRKVGISSCRYHTAAGVSRLETKILADTCNFVQYSPFSPYLIEKATPVDLV